MTIWVHIGISSIYCLLSGIVIRLKLWLHHPYVPRHPVLSVGSIYAGGTGKTPVSLLIGNHVVRSRGMTPAFLSRGYGRKTRDTRIISPGQKCEYSEIGDEPMLLHHSCPHAWLGISSRRSDSARILDSRLPDRSVYILDDGFQHCTIARNADIVCIPPVISTTAFWRYGFLREFPSALHRTHIICVVANAQKIELMQQSRDFLQSQFPQAHIFPLIPKPTGWIHLTTGEKTERPPLSQPLVITGIANPKRFIELLDGYNIVADDVINYPDHHPFSEEDILRKLRHPSQSILTTEKDAMRMRSVHFVYSLSIWYLKLEYQFESKKLKQHFFSLLDTLLF